MNESIEATQTPEGSGTIPTVHINKELLRLAIQRWEQDHRDGKCRPYEESRDLPMDQVVQESTDTLWGLLTEPAPAA